MGAFKIVFFGSKPWWMFWHPGSSFAGGLILGFLLWVVVIVAFELFT